MYIMEKVTEAEKVTEEVSASAEGTDQGDDSVEEETEVSDKETTVEERAADAESKYKEIRRDLRGLFRAGRVVKLTDKRFALPSDEDHVVGRIIMNRRGGGRVITADVNKSAIEIAPNSASTAIRYV